MFNLNDVLLLSRRASWLQMCKSWAGLWGVAWKDWSWTTEEGESVDLRQMLPAAALRCSSASIGSARLAPGWAELSAEPCRLIVESSPRSHPCSYSPHFARWSPPVVSRNQTKSQVLGTSTWFRKVDHSAIYPSISATVQHGGAPQGEPKIPSVPPLKNQLPNFGRLRWHDNRQAEVCWKRLIHNLRNLHLFFQLRAVADDVEDLAYVGGQRSWFLPVEMGQPSSAQKVWNLRMDFLLYSSEKRRSASWWNPFASSAWRGSQTWPPAPWQSSGGHLGHNRPSDHHWTGRAELICIQDHAAAVTEAVRLDVGQVELSAAGDFNRYRVRDLQLVLGVPFGAPVEVEETPSHAHLIQASELSCWHPFPPVSLVFFLLPDAILLLVFFHQVEHTVPKLVYVPLQKHQCFHK